MKSFVILFISLGFGLSTLCAQNTLTEAEYFFDADPGVGNAQSIALGGSGSLDDSFVVPIDQLSDGIHILHVRVKNDLDQWSFYARQTFYIAVFSNALDNILTEAEYFFDTDPGVGNAQSIAITNSGSIDEGLAIPIDQLPSGIHILHVRVKNDLDQWSFYARQTFYIAAFSGALDNTITEAEYFFDADPGVGNANSLTIAENASLDTGFSIPLDGLSVGIHVLHIRTKNNLDQWSLYARQTFYNAPQILDHELVAAEYFIDVDPGVGNATPVGITQGASVDELLSIAIPEDLPAGDHVLHLRVQRSDGVWSVYGRPEFSSTPLSTDDLVLEQFKLYPNPVDDVLNLSISNATLEQVTIIDLNGKVILEQFDDLEQLQLQTLASGPYLVHIKTSSGMVSKKIIKK